MQEDGEVFVVQSRCPHREYPLEGAFLTVLLLAPGTIWRLI